ncbi:hypothetical protein Asi03nite_56200 [Actinoplanes siamensis]|uniref:HTH cro/C1-type domain-containing protein n=1 Tax=Actinoplanes siamensis TaxID=1223317 RepID=A0A919NBG4_9ACTN|nr:hypothetical protein Asi03nite_56200 [Actinoplanes siamensis]
MPASRAGGGAQRARRANPHRLASALRELRANVPRTGAAAVARFEAGGTVPTLVVLERLARALGTSLQVSFQPQGEVA